MTRAQRTVHALGATLLFAALLVAAVVLARLAKGAP